MNMTLTEHAKVGYFGNENPHLWSSPAWYAHVTGQYMHDTGRSPPNDVRMGRGDSIRVNGMRFKFHHEADKRLSFERVE